MIELNLRVSDPTRQDGPKLLALAALFTSLAQGTTAEQARAQLEEKTTAARPERVVGAPTALAAPYAGPAIDPADNPATGMPTPAEAFGAGNDVAASVSASSQANALTSAASDAVALPDPAQVFAGSAPNVPPPAAALDASSVTTNGTPPAPNSGAATGGANIPASVPGVELDSEGIPWDASIHASTKGKIANGTWKVKRGTPELYLKERKAQLKAAVSVGQQTTGNAAVGVPATPPAPVTPPPAGAGAPIPPPPPSSAGNVPAPIPTPQASAQTTPGAASSNTVTLAQLLPRVTAAIGAGTLTADTAGAIVRELSGGKIESVAMLAVAPALIPQFVAQLDALGIPA